MVGAESRPLLLGKEDEASTTKPTSTISSSYAIGRPFIGDILSHDDLVFDGVKLI